jgi:hypothetical protein
MMTDVRWAVLAPVLLLTAVPSVAQLRIDALLNHCKQKVQVLELLQGKPQVVGEQIAGLCEGYLVGTYDALIDRKLICAPDAAPSTD